MDILINIFTVVLLLVSAFLVLLVLAQKAKSDGGVGAAMGAGVTEATFGAETGNVLTNLTIKSSIAFFVLSFGLYLGQIYQHKHKAKEGGELPTITAPATAPVPAPAPANTAPEAAPAQQPGATTTP